jgi:transcriptional regulator with XRE-family HTH domain
MTRTPAPRTNVRKAAHVRARNLRRDVIRAFQEALDDGGLSRRTVCRAAGIGPDTFAAIERDDREPTIEVLARLAAVLGGELSVRFFPARRPRPEPPRTARVRTERPTRGRDHRQWVDMLRGSRVQCGS